MKKNLNKKLLQALSIKFKSEFKKNIKPIIFFFIAITGTLMISSIAFSFYLYQRNKNNAVIKTPSLTITDNHLETLEKKIGKHVNSQISEPSRREIKFLFFGDMMLDRNVGEKIKKNGLDYLFEELPFEDSEIADPNSTNLPAQAGRVSTTTAPTITRHSLFQGIDLIGCNLEGAVTNNGAHYAPNNAYDFAFPPDLINGLKNYKFNFFNLANNHFSDQGKTGMEETTINLNKLGFNYNGCADAKVDDCSSKIIEIAGKKIGMAGFSMVYNNLDEEKVKKTITDLASSTDFVIVNMHWGVEYQHQFNKQQQNIAHKIIDAGADIIIGHHPHVVQGMEIYDSERATANDAHPNDKKGLIFYSLGNFIFDQYFSPDTQEGLAAGINITDEKIDIFLYPLKSEKSRPRLMAGEEKENFFEKFISWSKISEEYKNQIVKEHLSFYD